MDIRTFLAHAVKRELDPEQAYQQLTALTQDSGTAMPPHFSEMAGFSRMHREMDMRRAGFTDLSEIPAVIAAGPSDASPTEISPPP